MVDKYKELPSQEYLIECFNYDEESGDLIWKNRPIEHFKNKNTWVMWNSKFANTKAGSAINTGYESVVINSLSFVKHRVIWKFATGNEPIGVIDHINNNKGDNRIDNLRDVNTYVNQQNKRKPFNNSSGYENIGICSRSGKFVVTASKNKIQYYIGLFDNVDDAVIARDKFHNEFENNIISLKGWEVKDTKTNIKVSLDVLNTLMYYKDGCLIWKHRENECFGMSNRQITSFNSRFSGKKVGGKAHGGYIRFELFGKKLLLHRIIYQICHGLDELPKDMVIDHVDGDTTNNRIENLKLATKTANGVNKRTAINNTSGYTGISVSNNGKFKADIRIDGKNKRLGTFDTIDEAISAREAKREEIYGGKISIR